MNKSPYDTNEYKSIVLNNELRVVFVNNKNSTKSGVSLSVSVGSFDETIEGTAHFLEHLLFMGSTKYPDENKYGSFISENGGYTNAYTADTYTNYMFEINSEKLIEALDIFSQMFVSSLLNESAIERELQAVNSEFTNYCNSDGWRTNEVFKCIGNKNHPFTKFNVGNEKSLNIPGIMDHVRELYESKYSANLMNLVIVTNIEFDQLESPVRSMFEQIKNKNYTMNKIYPPFYTSLQKTIYIVPIKNKHTLNITWQVKSPSEMDNYKWKPLLFLSHILGHECEGSILSTLKKLNLASSLSAYTSENCFTYELFTINITLSNEGMKNIDNVLNVVYNYISLCMSQFVDYSTCEILYNDKKNSDKLSWTFSSQQNELNYAIQLSSHMHKFNHIDIKNLLFAPYYFEEFNSYAHKLIINSLCSFTQENSVICISSKQFEDNQLCYSTEQWYKALYTVTNSNILQITSFCENLKLPSPNIFVPNDVNMHVNDNNSNIYPQLITNTESLKIFCKKTNKFGLPHACCYFNLELNEYKTSPEIFVKMTMLSKVIMAQLNDILYYSTLLDYYVNFSDTFIIVYGYCEKLPILLSLIINEIIKGKLNNDAFNLIKEELEKAYSNEKFSDPSKLVFVKLREQINPICMTTKQKLEYLQSLTCLDLENFAKTLKFDNCTALFEGNIDDTFIEKMTNEIKKLNYIGIDNYLKNDYILPHPNVDFIISNVSENPKEKNDCVAIIYCYEKSHFLVHPTPYKLYVLQKLVNIFISEPFFDELRTKQQLGYTVYSYDTYIAKQFEQFSTQVYLIQSPTTSCDELIKRIDIFINNSIEKIKILDDTLFSTYVESLQVKLLKPYNNLIDECVFDYDAINDKHYIFDNKKLILDALNNVTKDDLILFFLEYYKINTKRYIVNLIKTC